MWPYWKGWKTTLTKCGKSSHFLRSHNYRPQWSWGKVIFSEACVNNSVHGGACVVARGGVHGCSGCVCGFIWGVCVVLFRGHVWFYSGGVHGFIWGACMVLFGGYVVLFGGHAWFYLGACVVLFRGHAWFYSGGVRGFSIVWIKPFLAITISWNIIFLHGDIQILPFWERFNIQMFYIHINIEVLKNFSYTTIVRL